MGGTTARAMGAMGLAVLVLAGWPPLSAAQRPAEAAAQRVQATLAADMASEDEEIAVGALLEVLRIPRPERGPALRGALIAALEARGRRPDEGAPPAPGYEALAAHTDVLLEEVRAMEDPAAIPALLWSPGFGILDAVRIARLGCGARVAALEAALEMAGSGADRVNDGLFTLRIMAELWGGREAIPPDAYALLVDAAALYLNGPGERYTSLTSSSVWRSGGVMRRALGLAAVLGDPGLRARMEQIAADAGVTRQMGVTGDLGEGVPLNLQTLAAALLAGKPPEPHATPGMLRATAPVGQLPSAGRDDPGTDVLEALPAAADIATGLESGECVAHFERAWTDDYTPVPLRVEFPPAPTPPGEPPRVFEHERLRGDVVSIRTVCVIPSTAWHREYLERVLAERLDEAPMVTDAGGWMRLRSGWSVIRSPSASPETVCVAGGRPASGDSGLPYTRNGAR